MGRGKRSKEYNLKKRRIRRQAKRRSRREGRKDSELPRASKDSLPVSQGYQQEEDTHALYEARTEDHNTDESEHNDEKPTSSRQTTSMEMLKADNERLRRLLDMEQRRPRILEKECYECVRRRNTGIAAGRDSLHQMMFSGKTFGSRYLLAAINKNNQRRRKS